ncbi:hypothetical protein [Velocimicrobium porci]|uniref:Uncharacterized protein n=1 Tax=Velocimicrobium porci TaxID=2606634 RepID=A0A6L5XU35_9FIRM|nr:hypothetical protein [Velocimicrobium porci]MSS62285.1 hypothetical protein [Velocimicrobium porci]
MFSDNFNITDYKKVIRVEKISPVKKVNQTKSFEKDSNWKNAMELTKQAMSSFGKDVYEKEEKQKIGGIDLDQVLFTYDKVVVEQSQKQTVGEKVDKHIEKQWKSHKSDYAYLADENGIIEYKGSVFLYNSIEDVITLGDMTNEDDVLNITLSGGTVLRVNRDNIDDLVKAIGMFKPEDIKKIVEAIATDAKAKSKPIEVDKKVADTYEEIFDKKNGIRKRKRENEED